MKICPRCQVSYEDSIDVCPHDKMSLIYMNTPIQIPEEDHSRDLDTAVRDGLRVGDFQVNGILAEGGMGVIYAGIHPLIRKRVAIKVLNKRFAQDPKSVLASCSRRARSTRSATTTSSTSSPSVSWTTAATT